MRLFTAIDIPDTLRSQGMQLIEQLRPSASIRWSPAENLHITTKFIGHVTPESLHSLETALHSLRTDEPITIQVRGLGWLPNPHAPRILCLGVEASPALVALHTRTDAAMAALGIPCETRPYHPHLTLARIPKGSAVAELRQTIATLQLPKFEAFEAQAQWLFESQQQPAGSIYRKRAPFPV